MSAVRVADVALDPKWAGADAVYTYRAAADTTVGEAVFVTLGARSTFGFVISVYDATEEELGFPFGKLKSISTDLEGLSLPIQLVRLAEFVAREYLCSLPVALAPSMPPGARGRLTTAWSLNLGIDVKLTPLEQEIVRTLQDVGGTLTETKTKPIPPSSLRALRTLKTKGVVTRVQRVDLTPEKRGAEMLQLTSETDRIETFLVKEGRKKPAQALTLMRLQTESQVQLTQSELKALAGVTDTTIRALINHGLLVVVDPTRAAPAQPPEPNRYQQLAIDAVSDAVKAQSGEGFLLFGVTGSGKTEVYLRAAGEALKQGRQVLYIVPEIALATQAIAQLRSRFGSAVAVLHSELPGGERLRNWIKIREGKASIVLGARSAIFAPLDNIGLIILDEEHEASYKQESAPRYHTRTLAKFLALQHRCPVVFGSATPSVESFFDAEEQEQGRPGLTLLSLPQRAASAQLPEVDIEDLTLGYRAGNPMLLTPELQSRIRSTLDRGEQVILFLNRRAYAPFLICRDCGARTECPNCAVSLSFHRKEQRLRCHHCGYSAKPPSICPKCGGSRMNPFGAGTEKVEELVAETFPDTKVARLDRDIARRKGALEEILTEFRSGEIGILVGTQMVAKGLDFPNVTLVGVIAADVSLNIPDFRSSERTYQLLSQVSGRAGRGTSPGTVVIQTFNPQHPAVTASRMHEYLPFYEELKAERMEAGYPPFSKLVNIIFSGESLPKVRKAAIDAAERLSIDTTLAVLGPVDCAVERIQGRWRRHVLLKLPRNESVHRISDALLGFDPEGVQVVIDVDPHNLM